MLDGRMAGHQSDPRALSLDALWRAPDARNRDAGEARRTGGPSGVDQRANAA